MSNEITSKMREIAKKLLTEKKVDLVIGWEKGRLPYQSPPVLIDKIEDTEKLIWDEYCANNLTHYLIDYKDSGTKIALFVKGCDSRGIIRLIQDNVIKREDVYIIGINCPGVKDKNGTAEKCKVCEYPEPVISDEVLGEKSQISPEKERFSVVEDLENMTPDEKYAFWQKQYDKCIRCFACRNVCPACNCKECIFDQGEKWLARRVNESENGFYHITRAMHVAGRCIECGECERVCPMEIPLMKLNKKIAKDINTLFGPYEAGLDKEEDSPLGQYKVDDPEEFM